MSEKGRAEPAENIENNLKTLRISKGLSQGDLSRMAGVTRQAIYAIETGQYLPTTGVALHLSHALGCRVEDLFRLISSGEIIEGDFVGTVPPTGGDDQSLRVKVARIGTRFIVRPMSALSQGFNFSVAADGLLAVSPGAARRPPRRGDHVRVQLLRDRKSVESEIHVAGCDPAIVLAGEYLRARADRVTIVEWTMGSATAIEALKQGEVHIAGLHVRDAKSGECNLPYLRKHLKGLDVKVVSCRKRSSCT
jgi:DNA-binding XRE family transcriptional regulator